MDLKKTYFTWNILMDLGLIKEKVSLRTQHKELFGVWTMPLMQ